MNLPPPIAKYARPVLFGAAAVAVFAFFRGGRDGELAPSCQPLCEVRPEYAGDNRTAPDFELEKLTGGRARLRDYAGKSIVMNFWTKHCPPCLREMPSLGQFAKTLKQKGNAVLISVCTDDTREDVLATLREVFPDGAPFDVLLDPESKVVTGLYGTKLYPETWFIDPDGVIRLRIDGPRDYTAPVFSELVDSLTLEPRCKTEFRFGAPRGHHAELCGIQGR